MKRRNFLFSSVLSTLLPRTGVAKSFSFDENSVDLVVIGTGLAGLSAAISAREAGIKNVLLLEKRSTIGGHSILSTGYFSCVRQQDNLENFNESVETMVDAILKTGGNIGDKELVDTLVRESGSAADWLESYGVVWTPDIFQTLGGLSPRTLISSFVRSGYDYVIALNQAVQKLKIRTIFNATAEELVVKQSIVQGLIFSVEGIRQYLPTKAVVIATGGFGANIPMRLHYDPRLTDHFATTADPNRLGTDGATGDGIILAQNIGASLSHMEFIQTIPFWGGRLTDYVGADIYINAEGKRFVNEAAPWKEISSQIWTLPNQSFWVITDSQSKKGASFTGKLIQGIVKQAESVEKMALDMNISPMVLNKTLDEYNSFAEQNYDPIFGKNRFTQKINKPPFYYGKENLFVHFCCGGISIRPDSSVITSSGATIKGLFAAGEVTGGIHGQDRLGGCSLPDCVVFGRKAGYSAGSYLKRGYQGR